MIQRQRNKTLSLFAVFFLFINTQPISGEPAYGDAIIAGSIGDASTLIPILASDSASQDIVGLVFNGLLKYDKNIKLVGDLAESWKVSSDKLTITFHLRKNVRWHDGFPFTASDVMFTYKKLTDPDVPTPYSGDFERIKKAEVVDPYTFRVTYKEQFSPALASWGMWIMPEHLLKDKNLIKCSFARHPIGTGPYKFKEWKTGQRIVLKANNDYFEGRPYIDKYVFQIIPDDATMFLELSAGNVDWMGLNPVQYTYQTNKTWFKTGFNKYKYPSFGYTYLGYNLKNWLFKNKLVRQALTYAINKTDIIKGVLLGLGEISTGPFPPESWAYNKHVRRYPYNPLKAKEMLKLCGWKDHDGDGWIDKDGKVFEFEIITNQGNAQRKKCAEIIQQNLRLVGIKVNIRIIEWASFINEFINKKRFEAVLLAWGLGRDPDCFDIWHSSKTKAGEFNFISYSNLEVDKLLEDGRKEFEYDKRRQIYHRIHEIIAEDQACTFLYVPDSLPVVNARFKDVEVSPIGISYNFIKWHVPKQLQKHTQ